MKRSTALQLFIGLLIAAIGVWVFSRQVDLSAMLGKVQETPWWKIVVVVLFCPLTLLLRAWRWKVLLPSNKGCSKDGLFPLVTIGFMVNNFIPARVGEAVRAALLWNKNNYTIAESVGSLLVERLLDILVYVIFLFWPIFVLPELSSLRYYGLLFAGGVGASIFCFIIYRINPLLTRQFAIHLLKFIPDRLGRFITRIGKELLSNVDWVFSRQRTLLIVILSFATILCQVAMIQALGLGVTNFGLFVSMFTTACAAVGAAIPLSPGYVGTLHSAMLQGMEMAGIAPESAGAVAVLYHAIGYVTISLMGIYYFFKMKLTLKDINKAKSSIASS